MRALHRDVGFFMVGLIIIYTLSGLTLAFRDSEFLKMEQQIEKELEPRLDAQQLGEALRIRGFNVTEEKDGVLYFQNGSYDSATGLASYMIKDYPAPMNKFVEMHKAIGQSKINKVFSILMGASLLFLSVSSFWMFKKGSKLLKRGLVFSAVGILVTIGLMLI